MKVVQRNSKAYVYEVVFLVSLDGICRNDEYSIRLFTRDAESIKYVLESYFRWYSDYLKGKKGSMTKLRFDSVPDFIVHLFKLYKDNKTLALGRIISSTEITHVDG